MRECCSCNKPILRGYKCVNCKLTGHTRIRRCRDCTKVVTQYQRCPKHRAARALMLKLRRRARAKNALKPAVAA